MGEKLEKFKDFFRRNKGKIASGAKKAVVVSFIIGVAISAVACSDKTGNQDLDQNNDGPGIQAPIGGGEQTGTQTPSTPSTPDVPVTPDVPDVPVTPDVPDQPVLPDVPDVPVTPDIPDVPVTPEKTEAEYKVECEEIVTEKINQALTKKYKLATIDNVKIEKINIDTGDIYCSAEHTQSGYTSSYFYTINSELKNCDSYKEVRDLLDTIDLNVESRQTNIEGLVSEEKYNELCEYVLGEVGLEGAEVLNATQFSSVGGGMRGVEFTVLKGDKVYAIQANAHSGDQSTQEGHINSMLNSSTNEISITSEENFEDFDMIGRSLENLSFEQEIGGEKVSMKLAKGENGKYSLDFNFCSFGDDGFGF